MSTTRHILTFAAVLLLGGLFLGGQPLAAQVPPEGDKRMTPPEGDKRRIPPKIDVEPIECLPQGDNGVVYATIAPELGGTLTELFFRWEEDEDFYYVHMLPDGGGRYWGVPPKPDPKNETVEYYVAVTDPAGQVLAKSDSLMAPVENRCEVELTQQQRGVAENLTVGETTAEQVGLEVDGFLCDGVVTRIGHDRVVRGDELCRACVIAWHEKAGILIPSAAGLAIGGILITRESPPEASPTTP